MNFDVVYSDAKKSGDAAVEGMSDGYPCGFASLNIKPATSKFVKYLKARNIGRKGYSGGWTLSSYDCSKFSGQNVDAKEAGVRAFAKVLEIYGITCTTESRLD
jgi:hypothetical protein